jgi:hypothetical protein
LARDAQVTPTTVGRSDSLRQRAVALAGRVDVRLVSLWLALGAGLAILTSRVVDWYVMTDELLYERLGISIAQGNSPLPRIHGESIDNINQLYPLLLAPLFHNSLVPPALHEAHVLNAFVMSSACIPAFLIARRVTQSLRMSYLVAALSVCIPWIALSSFLMTEVVAYPAFLWAVLALHHAAVSPSVRSDVAVIVALAVATVARTQFAVFLVIVPVALFLHQVAFTPAPSLPRRLGRAARRLAASHRPLVLVYTGLAVVVLAPIDCRACSARTR